MKAIIVTPYMYPHSGGVEVYTLNIARHLKDLGWEVVLVTASSSRKNSIGTLEGMKVYYLGTTISISNTPVGVGWRRKLKKIYTEEAPDVINAHMPVPYLGDMAQRASGSIPFVLTYHNDICKDFLPY